MNTIYTRIGNLFYAIAVDRGLTDLEFPKLKMLINRQWPRGNSSALGSLISDEGHVILLTIDSLRKDRVSAGEAYRNFEQFYMVYPEAFTAQLKTMVLDIAATILDSFEVRGKGGAIGTATLRELLYPVYKAIY